LGSPKIRTYPAGLVKIAAVIGDIIAIAGFDNFPLTSFRLNNILTEYVFDMAEVRRIVPKLPYAMLPAVRETADWIRSQSSLVT
jgi:hypothetical protein